MERQLRECKEGQRELNRIIVESNNMIRETEVKYKGYLKQFAISCVIFTNKFNLLDRVGLYRVVSNKMKKANINKKGIHILRHTFAKNLVAKNINLSTIKDLLGHEDIATTMIYAKTNEENKIMAVKRL